MSEFRDFDGNLITLEQWAVMFEDIPSRILAQGCWGVRGIRTIWIGGPFVEGALSNTLSTPLYGSALFNNGHYVKELDGYMSREAAAAGHAELFEKLKNGEQL